MLTNSECQPVPDFTVIHLENFTGGHFTSSHTQKPNTSSHSKHPSVCLMGTHFSFPAPSQFHINIANTCLSRSSHTFADKHSQSHFSFCYTPLLQILQCNTIVPWSILCATSCLILNALWENWSAVGLNGPVDPIIYLHAAFHFKMFSLNHPQFLCSSLPKTLPLPE